MALEETKKGKMGQKPKGPPLSPDDQADEAEKKFNDMRKKAKALREAYDDQMEKVKKAE